MQIMSCINGKIPRIQIKTIDHSQTITHLGLPRKAAWCNELKPLLLVMPMSATCSRSKLNMSSLFLLMASCRAVSPSESWLCRKNRTVSSVPQHETYNQHRLLWFKCQQNISSVIYIPYCSLPSKHMTINQRCFNVERTSKTVGQHLNNIVLSSHVCLV